MKHVVTRAWKLSETVGGNMERKTDNEIKQQVKRELLWDSRLWSAEINVAVRDGGVALTGTRSDLRQEARGAGRRASHLWRARRG